MGRRSGAADRRLRAIGATPLTAALQRPYVIAAASLAALFALLAGLVATGARTGLDQFAVDRLMPGLGHGPVSQEGGRLAGRGFAEVLVPRFREPIDGGVAASLSTYIVVLIGAVLPSALIVGGALLVLARRGRRALTGTLAAAFVAAVAVEVLAKSLLVRPELHLTGRGGSLVHVIPFDASFPSGHALRATLIAICVAVVWPRLRLVLGAWALAVPVLLVAGGWHTPTDVVAGTVLAGAFAAAAVGAAPLVEARWPALRPRRSIA